ncbi:MAG: L-glutamate gamma-semialdehyde dehydrogenase [Candidatus Wallbacteria bacterium]
MLGHFQIPKPQNEKIYDYSKGTKEANALKAELKRLSSETIEIPLFINGKEVFTGSTGEFTSPHNHSLKLAKYHKASKEHVQQAIDSAMAAKKEWENYTYHERASIFLRAAELLAGPYRATLNAATMLGQSKTAYQAEIDSACEAIDFLRFNSYFMSKIYENQPNSSAGIWNYMEYRPLDGFVFAVTPFNFTAIALNLITSVMLMGNTVVWKPAMSALYSAHFIVQLLKKAGLPDGVLNMLQGPGSVIGPMVITDPNLAGIHFTGSTDVFNGMYKSIGENIAKYRCYPRLVGETGGKDFIFAHSSADVKALKAAMVRGSYEYQGQKCSAASRAYIPKSVWNAMKDDLIKDIKAIKMGDPEDFSNFMSAVIDNSSFENIKKYIDYAANSNEAQILAGGGCDKSKGYFVEPTLILTTNPMFKTMHEEIFGPVMTVYVYDDADYEKTLDLCVNTSVYALTGSIFADSRQAIKTAFEKLRHSAGNFYINDKPTGAVVGQQPFGGSMKSGTNDKAGSYLNLIRWVSPRAIKETLCPSSEIIYDYMKTHDNK